MVQADLKLSVLLCQFGCAGIISVNTHVSSFSHIHIFEKSGHCGASVFNPSTPGAEAGGSL